MYTIVYIVCVNTIIVLNSAAQDTIKVDRVSLPGKPAILNIVYHEYDEDLYGITYDLLAPPNSGPFNIIVNVLVDRYPYRELQLTSVLGDVGENVTPGRNKKIIWWITGDMPVKNAGEISGINLVVEEIRKTRENPPVFIDLGGGYQTQTAYNQQLELTNSSIRFNVSFPIIVNILEYRFGLIVFRTNTKYRLTDELDIRDDDPIIGERIFYGISGGLGILIGNVRITADFERTLSGDGRPHPLLPYYFITSHIQVRSVGRLYIGVGLTFYRERELLDVRYDRVRTLSPYIVKRGDIIYYPNISLSIRI